MYAAAILLCMISADSRNRSLVRLWAPLHIPPLMLPRWSWIGRKSWETHAVVRQIWHGLCCLNAWMYHEHASSALLHIAHASGFHV